VSSRAAWVLCLVAGLTVVALTLVISGVEGVRACDGGTALDPVIRFEWVRTVEEVRALFGEEPCRSRLAAAMDRVNRIDIYAFIPAFTLFQLFAAWALRRSGRGLALAAGAAAIVAALCDQAEDQILLAITASLPGEQALIDQLFWFVRVKFGLLALAAGCLGLLLARTPGAERWLGLAMLGGAAIAFAGLIQPQLLTPGIALAWAALLAAAVLHVARGRRGAAAATSSGASSSPRP
jgi:hypothetical protein